MGCTLVPSEGPSSCLPWSRGCCLPLTLSLLPPEPTSCRRDLGRRPPTWPPGEMSACGRKALTLLSSVFAVCGLGLLGIAVSTDYWLYLEEGVVLPQNQSTEIKMSLHSGLWRVCFLAGKGTRGCGQPRPGERSSPSLGKPVRDPPSPPPPLGSGTPAGRTWFTTTVLIGSGRCSLQQPGPFANSSSDSWCPFERVSSPRT